MFMERGDMMEVCRERDKEILMKVCVWREIVRDERERVSGM